MRLVARSGPCCILAACTLIMAFLAVAGSVAEEEEEGELERLGRFERERRAATDFASLPPSNGVTGPDPFAIRALPGTSHLVATLRGRDAVVVLDDDLEELERHPAPASPTGIAISGGRVFVSGELSGSIASYEIRGDGRLRPSSSLAIPGLVTVRDLAAGEESTLYLVEEERDRLVTIGLQTTSSGEWVIGKRRDLTVGRGPIRVERIGDLLLVNCLLDHSLVVLPVDTGGLPSGMLPPVRITHDGPLWCFDAQVSGGALLIAAGGVEDHPLDRSGGFFGYIDSFLFLYRVDLVTRAAERVAAVNLSEIGLVTPKWVRLDQDDEAIRVVVTGYGGEQMASVVWGEDSRPPRIDTRPLPPGITEMAFLPGTGWAGANSLLDSWILAGSGRRVPVKDPPDGHSRPARSAESKLGEILFFTGLMAPRNESAGAKSRFACETCHFEGYVDGRTHFTGRGEVYATTKPLLGLFNNKPHFSRALDPDLTTMVENEFHVAGAESGLDPWFSLPIDEHPWLGEVLGRSADISPGELRKALMAFLMDFSHRPNPVVWHRLSSGQSDWTESERRGAAVFRQYCASCHAPRLIADDPTTEVPFADWEAHVMSREGPVVWGSGDYAKTGVEPYVHEEGARVPSLRRLYKKRPYFTNGSAPDLAAVLERVRLAGDRFYHHRVAGGDSLRSLDGEERTALLAFLRLL